MKKLFIIFFIAASFNLFAQDFQISLSNEYSVDIPHLAISNSKAHVIYGTNFYYYKFDVNGPVAPIENPIRPADVYGPNTTDIAANGDDVSIIYTDYHYDYYSGASFYGCYVVQSTDGGDTWGIPVLLDTIQLGSSLDNIMYNIPIAEYSDNGNLYLLWRVHMNDCDTNALYLSKNLGPKQRIDSNTDNALELAINLTVNTFTGPDFVAVSYGKTENSEVKFYLKYSKDAASTFTEPILVKNDGDTFLTSDHQTNVFLYNDGRIKYVYSDFAHGPYLATSTDWGENWTSAGTVEAHKYVYVAIDRMPGFDNYFVKSFYDDYGNLSFYVSTDLLSWISEGKLNSDSAQVAGWAGTYLEMEIDTYALYSTWIDNRTGYEEIFYGINHLPTIDVNDNAEIPTDFKLLQNYPNPFNPSTTIEYQLPTESKVTVEIFNSLGQRVSLLVNKVENAGYHSVVWNACSVNNQAASGTHIVRLTAVSLNDGEAFTNTRKMLLLK